jgi:ubiquinone/menaquinone biosynthesis C-methylase UbiE
MNDSELARVLEPEVMDSVEEASDYDAMDHREVNRRFVADLLAAWQPAESAVGEVLDLGTGTAQIPIELGRQCAAARVVAVDLAETMLARAAQNVLAAGLSDRITLERVDGKRLPYATGRFAVVMSNSIVHHIPVPATVLAEAVRVTAPGGLLLVRDLLRPRDAAMLDALVDTYAGDANAHQRAMFAASLHAALTLDEVCRLVVALGFEPATVTATSDRHWTWQARKLTGPEKLPDDGNR